MKNCDYKKDGMKKDMKGMKKDMKEMRKDERMEKTMMKKDMPKKRK